MSALKEKLLALAERVERAAEEDRNLDVEIWLLTDREKAECYDRQDAPPFTSSLDAALTLVPAGSRWALGRPFDRPCFAACDPPEPSKVSIACEARKPVLALCAAALRARSAA